MGASRSPTSAPDAALDFAAERGAIDAALAATCARSLAGVPALVAEAIRYSLLGEGKRLRPLLAIAAYRALSGPGDPTPLASAIEIVHAYSLVHDDLPCMDDDAMRRGRPTTHRVFGSDVAMLAGVAMVPLAAFCAWDAAAALGLPEAVRGRIVRELMTASGAGGMVGGQLLDLEGELRPLGLEELERVHRAKTGALISASVRIGALAAGASEAQLASLTGYGDAVGLAFQIADDVLDATSTTAVLGKTAGRDAERHKSTYASVLGVEGAIARATALIAHGCAALDDRLMHTRELTALAQYAVSRSS